MNLLISTQKRAERLARQRDDPYYITDRPSKPLASTSHQIDTIPIIRLDDLPSISARELLNGRYQDRILTAYSNSPTIILSPV